MADVRDEREIVYSPAEAGNLALRVIDERRRNPGGVRLGIPCVDEALLPLRPGELCTVIGRPSNYKSGLLQYWARKVARDILAEDAYEREIVVFVTWEMAVEEIVLYDLAASTRLVASDIAQGRVDEAVWEKLQAAAMNRASVPLWLIGHSIERRRKRPRLALSNVAKALQAIDEELGLHPRAVFLDYLQLMESEGRLGEERTRRMDVFENVYRCKDMALALGCPVILGCQARREVDEREWKLPAIGDGQESSGIEFTSDKIITLWFPRVSEELGAKLPGTELVVSDDLLILGLKKQKMGPAGMWWPLYVDPAQNIITDRDDVLPEAL